MKNNSISAVLVIINEEVVLERCLKNIKPVVDEIIVVHDGECNDKSLEIAKKYNAKIFIQPFVGEAEFHRPFAFSQALGDWILHIDADEFISQKEVDEIPKLIQNPAFSAYEFLWPFYNHKSHKFLVSGPYSKQYRMCLYKKSDMYMLGLTHFHPKTIGKIKRIPDLKIGHIPKKSPFIMSEYKRKIIGWSKIYVSQFSKVQNLPYFGNKPKEEVVKYEIISAQNPILKMFLQPLLRILWFIKNGGLFCDPFNYKILLFDLSHIFFKYYYVYKLRSQKLKA